MLVAIAAAVVLAALALTFLVRSEPVTEAAGNTPWKHLEGRKAAIYDNLRDLQFEYRLGKLSDDDYQRTKLELQGELAGVMAEIDQLSTAPVPPATRPAATKRKDTKAQIYACPHCSAQFDKPLKFCGECGKPIGASA